MHGGDEINECCVDSINYSIHSVSWLHCRYKCLSKFADRSVKSVYEDLHFGLRDGFFKNQNTAESVFIGLKIIFLISVMC